MKLNIMGTRATTQVVSARHQKARYHSVGKNGTVKHYKDLVIKAVPDFSSPSPYMAAVWAQFGGAAHALAGQGKTMEEINAAVANAVRGLDTGADGAREMRKREDYAVAERNIQRFREIASRGRGGYSFRGQPTRESAYPPY